MIKFQQLLLKIAVAISRVVASQTNSLQPILPGHTPPEGIVQIEDDAFLPLSQGAEKGSEQVVGKLGINGLLERIFREIPHLRIIDVFISFALEKAIKIPDKR